MEMALLRGLRFLVTILRMRKAKKGSLSGDQQDLNKPGALTLSSCEQSLGITTLIYTVGLVSDSFTLMQPQKPGPSGT